MTWPGRRDWTIAANTALLTPCLLDPEIVRAIRTGIIFRDVLINWRCPGSGSNYKGFSSYKAVFSEPTNPTGRGEAQ